MAITTIILLASIGIVVGLLIGCIGIGGVVLVPILVQFIGVPVHQAIPIAMAGYVMTGIVGTWTFARMRTIDWSMTRWLWAGAMPGAIVGSFAAEAMPSTALKATVAVMTAICGIRTLLHTPPYVGSAKFAFRAAASLAVGSVAGFVSALTGTGGPVVLVPILMWLQAPVMIAIGMAQAIQLPIASLATLSYAAIGALNPLPSVVLGFSLSAGAVVGAHVAHSLDQLLLRKVVALILVGSALLLIAGAASDHFAAP